MEMDNDSTTELGIIVDYIRGKGYDVVGLSKMLSEELQIVLHFTMFFDIIYLEQRVVK